MRTIPSVSTISSCELNKPSNQVISDMEDKNDTDLKNISITNQQEIAQLKHDIIYMRQTINKMQNDNKKSCKYANVYGKDEDKVGHIVEFINQRNVYKGLNRPLKAIWPQLNDDEQKKINSLIIPEYLLGIVNSKYINHTHNSSKIILPNLKRTYILALEIGAMRLYIYNVKVIHLISVIVMLVSLIGVLVSALSGIALIPLLFTIIPCCLSLICFTLSATSLFCILGLFKTKADNNALIEFKKLIKDLYIKLKIQSETKDHRKHNIIRRAINGIKTKVKQAAIIFKIFKLYFKYFAPKIKLYQFIDEYGRFIKSKYDAEHLESNVYAAEMDEQASDFAINQQQLEIMEEMI